MLRLTPPNTIGEYELREGYVLDYANEDVVRVVTKHNNQWFSKGIGNPQDRCVSVERAVQFYLGEGRQILACEGFILFTDESEPCPLEFEPDSPRWDAATLKMIELDPVVMFHECFIPSRPFD